MIDETHAEHQWGAAIAQWFEREPSALSALIRDNTSRIPNYAREFLADLAEDKVSRGKGGRPVERDGWVERSIVAEVFAEWERSSKDAACAIVAKRRAANDGEANDGGEIRGVVDKLRRLGITRERWQAWGRPNWKNR